MPGSGDVLITLMLKTDWTSKFVVFSSIGLPTFGRKVE